MKHLGKTVIALLVAALAMPWFGSRVDAQSPTSLCIQIYNPNTASFECVSGWLPKLLNGLTATVTSVKNSAPGSLGLVYCYNENSSGTPAYIQIFDVATAAGVTLGTTVPKLSLGIPGAQSSGLGPTAVGVSFFNGIQVAVTTTPTGSSAPSSPMDCNVTYN